MSNPLSVLVDNLSEGFYNDQFEKTYEFCGGDLLNSLSY